jgi:hypothetical protein
LLHIAAGYYYCGTSELGYRIIGAARRGLCELSLEPRQRTAQPRPYAATLDTSKKTWNSAYSQHFRRLGR